MVTGSSRALFPSGTIYSSTDRAPWLALLAFSSFLRHFADFLLFIFPFLTMTGMLLLKNRKGKKEKNEGWGGVVISSDRLAQCSAVFVTRQCP